MIQSIQQFTNGEELTGVGKGEKKKKRDWMRIGGAESRHFQTYFSSILAHLVALFHRSGLGLHGNHMTHSAKK